MSLTEFLLARIAEDEVPILEMRAQYTDTFNGDGFRPWQSDWGNIEVCQTGTRALAECEAKRRIVEEHSPISPGVNINTSGYAPKDGPVCGCCGEPEWGCVAWPCLTLRALALPYADHPDFDPTWRA